jgi:hypothetical protein
MSTCRIIAQVPLADLTHFVWDLKCRRPDRRWLAAICARKRAVEFQTTTETTSLWTAHS